MKIQNHHGHFSTSPSYDLLLLILNQRKIMGKPLENPLENGDLTEKQYETIGKSLENHRKNDESTKKQCDFMGFIAEL